MPSELNQVKNFFRNHLTNCKKISLIININNLIQKSGFVQIENTLFFNLDLFNTFISNNEKLFSKKDKSFLLNYDLKGLNPALDQTQVEYFLRKVDSIFLDGMITSFDKKQSFFYNIAQSGDIIMVDAYYCIENDHITNLRSDFTILSDNFNDIFSWTEIDSNDFSNNSVLYFLLVPNYISIFSKQERETHELISEIVNQYFDLIINKRKFISYSIISLISLIIEQNLIKIYYKHANKLPSESSTLRGLNNSNASNEYCDVKKINNKWEIIFKPSSIKAYSKSDKIYRDIDSYAINIRNKIFHFQQGCALDLNNTALHAMRYFLNILMEIEDNGYL